MPHLLFRRTPRCRLATQEDPEAAVRKVAHKGGTSTAVFVVVKPK